MGDVHLSPIQKMIVSAVQRDFPIEHRPYQALAERIQSSESQVLGDLRQLQDMGLIRRIAASFQADQLGYASTLVAAKVSSNRVESFVADINSLPGVSHNYGRANDFNVWFTLMVSSEGEIQALLSRLADKHRLEAIHSLPAVRIFKLDVYFSPDETDDVLSSAVGHSPGGQATAYSPLPVTVSHSPNADATPYIPRPNPRRLDSGQKNLIRQLQQGISLVSEPFADMAQAVSRPEDDVLSQIVQWRRDGVIHRLGASVNYRQLGYQANAMLVMDAAESSVIAAGRELARYPQISHCYQRSPAPLWPYNLYAMTHARRQDQLQRFVKQIITRIRPRRYEVLTTTCEYKKSPVRYFAVE